MVLTDYVWDSLEVEKKTLGGLAELVPLQSGAPNEVRRVLSGEWPVNVVNRAVKGKNRAGL